MTTKKEDKKTPGASSDAQAGGRPRGGRREGGRPSFDRPRPEFEQKPLEIRRVTRVVAGGRRMSFAVTMAIGDRKGSVGLGTGKAADTSLAMTKAYRSAKKQMITLKLTKENSIPYDVSAKYKVAKVMIMPNRRRGLVAGSAVRDLLELAGVHNVTAKINSGSKNKLNNARAALRALSVIATRKTVAPETSQAYSA